MRCPTGKNRTEGLSATVIGAAGATPQKRGYCCEGMGSWSDASYMAERRSWVLPS
jgi:hypothetical protein